MTYILPTTGSGEKLGPVGWLKIAKDARAALDDGNPALAFNILDRAIAFQESRPVALEAG
ncbi:MAG: hypothetical protein F4Y03_02305 [Alphaproteobacteria bacterium]|nr:hypothetical protein [Alphaproteobacteria bacterium]